MLAVIPHVIQFLRYIRTLVKTKRESPKDDLISALVQAEEAGDKLNEDELVAMIFLLLVAGHETTVNLIEKDPRHPKYTHTAHGDGYRLTSE